MRMEDKKDYNWYFILYIVKSNKILSSIEWKVVFYMDALIEIFVEFFGELLFEVFIHFIAWIISLVITDIESNSFKKKVIKIICLVSCIILLVLSFIYSKTAYALLASIFLTTNIFIVGVRLINKTYFNNKTVAMTSIILTRISRITFYALIFVFLDTLKTEAAKITLISISSTAFALLTFIDCYRVHKYFEKKNHNYLDN